MLQTPSVIYHLLESAFDFVWIPNLANFKQEPIYVALSIGSCPKWKVLGSWQTALGTFFLDNLLSWEALPNTKPNERCWALGRHRLGLYFWQLALSLVALPNTKKAFLVTRRLADCLDELDTCILVLVALSRPRESIEFNTKILVLGGYF